MSWLDSLISFGSDNASWLAPAVGAIGGALSGGQNQTATSSSAPVLPENVKAGYDKLLGYAGNAFDRPFDARPTRRVETGGNAFQQLFQNPELQAIQDQSDAQFAYQQQQTAMQPPAQTTPQAQTQPSSQAQLAQTMERLRLLAGGENSVSGENRAAQQALHDLSIMKDMDGYQNEYTGGKFNLGEYLTNLNSNLDFSAINGSGSPTAGMSIYTNPKSKIYNPDFAKSQQIAAQERDDALRRPPEVDYLGPLAVALMTGGIGMGASALAGPALAGSITPTMAATGAKAVGSLAPRFAGGR